MKDWPNNPRGTRKPYDWMLVACRMRENCRDGKGLAPIGGVIRIVSASLDIEQPVLADFYNAVDVGALPEYAEFSAKSGGETAQST